MEDEGYMMTDMAHPFFTTAFFAAGVMRFDKMFPRRKTLQIMVKAKDNLGGKLTDRSLGGDMNVQRKYCKMPAQRIFSKPDSLRLIPGVR
jgi:hypothetical protein